MNIPRHIDVRFLCSRTLTYFSLGARSILYSLGPLIALPFTSRLDEVTDMFLSREFYSTWTRFRFCGFISKSYGPFNSVYTDAKY